MTDVKIESIFQVLLSSRRLGRARGGLCLWLVLLALAGCAHHDPAADLPLISSDINFRGSPPRPLTAPLPAAPAHAAGQTGWCVVVLDVDPSGVTRNHRLLDCDPREVFEASTLTYARALRYPESVHGYRDLQYRVDYR